MSNTDAFSAMIEALRMGVRIPVAEQARILAQAGKSQEDMAAALPSQPAASPGDPCECGSCPGHLVVLNSIPRGRHRLQYLGCCTCGQRPRRNKRAIPEEMVHRRRLLNAKQTGVSVPCGRDDNRNSEDPSCM